MKFCVDLCFRFSWRTPRSRIAGPYGGFMFDFLRNAQAVFHGSYNILPFHQQRMRGPVFLHPHRHFLFIVILAGVKWYLVFFICLSLMANDNKPLVMCLLTICEYFSEKCPFKSFAHFYTYPEKLWFKRIHAPQCSLQCCL